MLQPITIAIAEDHLLVRQGFVTMLRQEADFEVVFDVSNGQELLDQLKTQSPDVLLLDLKMPVMDGRSAFLKIREYYPNLKVIIVSTHFCEAYVTEFMREGVAGFLPKNCDMEDLIKAIRHVDESGFYLDEQVSRILFSGKVQRAAYPNDQLSDRQLDIVRLLYEEKTTDEIADRLCLSRRTIEWHKVQIFEKTQTNSSIGLMKVALAKGWVDA